MASLKKLLSKHENEPTVTEKKTVSRKKPRPEHTQFEKYLVIVINGNAVLQFLADIVLEILHLIPTRINHMSLTLLNAFIAFKTLSAVHKGKFQFLHEDCQILWLMEVCLIAGDVFHMLYYPFEPQFVYVRAAFLFCSLFNLVGISFIMWKYKLFSISYQGHKEKKKPTLTRMAVRSIVSIWKENASSKKVHVHDEDGPVGSMAAPNAASTDMLSGTTVNTSGKDSSQGQELQPNTSAHPIFGHDFGAQDDSSDEEIEHHSEPKLQQVIIGKTGRTEETYDSNGTEVRNSTKNIVSPFGLSKANRGEAYIAPDQNSNAEKKTFEGAPMIHPEPNNLENV